MNNSYIRDPFDEFEREILRKGGTPPVGGRTSGANPAAGGGSGVGSSPDGASGYGVGVSVDGVSSGGGDNVTYATRPIGTGAPGDAIRTQHVMFWNIDNWNEADWG